MAARGGAPIEASVLLAIMLAGCASSPSPTPTAPTSTAPTATTALSASTQPRSAAPAASAAASLASAAPIAWTPGPDAPEALTEVAAAAHDGRIWIAGGLRADSSATDAVYVFDPVSGDWSDGPRLPEPIHHSALVSDGDSMWLLGGYAGSSFDQPTDAVRRLRIGIAEGQDTWGTSAPLPQPRAAGAAAADGTGRIVYGGGVGPGVVSELVFAGTEAGFEPIARLSEPREHLAATTDGAGTIWFMGGRVGGLDGNLARVDRLEGTTITSLDDVLVPRGGVAAFHAPSIGPCLVGGESPSGTNAQVECVAADGSRVVLPELAFPRHGLGAVVIDGTAYVLLGGPEPGLTVSATVESIAVP